MHGRKHFDGYAVRGKELRYAGAADQYDAAVRCGVFTAADRRLRGICRTDPAPFAGGCIDFRDDAVVSADYFCRDGIYVSLQLFCEHAAGAWGQQLAVVFSDHQCGAQYFRRSVFRCRAEGRKQRMRSLDGAQRGTVQSVLRHLYSEKGTDPAAWEEMACI